MNFYIKNNLYNLGENVADVKWVDEKICNKGL